MGKDDLAAAKMILGANIFLIGSKLAVALLTGSIGVVAVLVDSCFDMLGGLFAYFGIKKGREPADADHHFGHRKYEALSSSAQIALIAITAILILLEAAKRLIEGRILQVNEIDLALMLATVLADFALVHYLRKAADQKNPAILAAIGNYTSDIMQNSLVFFGLLASMSGFYAADPIAAAIVAALMLRVAFRVGKEAIGDLTDQSPPFESLEAYGKEIMKVKGVRSFHRMRARKSSGKVRIDVHVQFPPKISIASAHSISRKVKSRLMERFPEVAEVLVHAEPDDKWQKNEPKYGDKNTYKHF
ncbi:MAG: cation diffusion facilitator family transporter [Candidatus Micrarchaeota archaeon]|nr:cation diffusion facilitator family transporter [Candidatus Micrarchaeota archaeon]